MRPLCHTMLALSTYTKVISAFGDDSKALASIFFTLSEIYISFIFSHPSKIESLMFLADNHSTFARLPQKAKQLLLTVVPLLNVTENRPLSQNAHFSIFFYARKIKVC